MKKKQASSVKERFLRYIGIETTSSAESEECPSAPGQLELGKLLRKELKEAGAENVVLK